MHTRWLLAIICRTLIIMRKFRICKISCKVYLRMHSIMINSARHELLEIAYILATNNLACTMCHQDDDIKWNHFPRCWPFVRGIHRSPVNSPHKGQWRGALMFPLICAWTNAWMNNREAGDLRRNRAHYDVIVMIFCFLPCIYMINSLMISAENWEQKKHNKSKSVIIYLQFITYITFPKSTEITMLLRYGILYNLYLLGIMCTYLNAVRGILCMGSINVRELLS